MRQSLGTAVFAGMLGVTGFGLLFTPIFYVLMRRTALFFARKGPPEQGPPPDPAVSRGIAPAVPREGVAGEWRPVAGEMTRQPNPD
jgi:hypothetical protein